MGEIIWTILLISCLLSILYYATRFIVQMIINKGRWMHDLYYPFMAMFMANIGFVLDAYSNFFMGF